MAEIQDQTKQNGAVPVDRADYTQHTQTHKQTLLGPHAGRGAWYVRDTRI